MPATLMGHAARHKIHKRDIAKAKVKVVISEWLSSSSLEIGLKDMHKGFYFDKYSERLHYSPRGNY